MGFEEEALKRWKKGTEKYKDTPENWKDWDDKRFITNAQEELLDCYNYLKQLNKKHKVEWSRMIMSLCKNMYCLMGAEK